MIDGLTVVRFEQGKIIDLATVKLKDCAPNP
jgi:hypothetical protein